MIGWHEGTKNTCSGLRVPEPVHQHDDGTWWFYDEVWLDELGPFHEREQCERELDKYVNEVLGP